jgi:uncharacterized damage-inducible protein DinB
VIGRTLQIRLLMGFAMTIWEHFRDDIHFSFRKQKDVADKALKQVSDENFFKKPGDDSNTLAAIVKHVSGNLDSRWTDFLTTDGDKPWRDRDAEFVIGPEESRQMLMTMWEKGWRALGETLASLTEEDLLKTVTIRGEPHTVMQAIHRSLAHTSYHVGQITFLARLLTKDGWQWITIPPGQSKAFKAEGKYLK